MKIVIALFVALLVCFESRGGIVEVGDLNVIVDPGNPSNGLRFLDMSFSDGLILSAALENAQAAYPNARLASPSEFDDLFAAAGINYENPSFPASSAFVIGGNRTISFGANYDAGALRDALGFTATDSSFFWSDPDGLKPATDPPSTPDFVRLFGTSASVWHTPTLPPNSSIGWLIVSTVPEPTTLEGRQNGTGLIIVDIGPVPFMLPKIMPRLVAHNSGTDA